MHPAITNMVANDTDGCTAPVPVEAAEGFTWRGLAMSGPRVIKVDEI